MHSEEGFLIVLRDIYEKVQIDLDLTVNELLDELSMRLKEITNFSK